MGILEEVGHFTWGFASEFFIETAQGNFVWSDPDYPSGDNTLKRFSGTYEDWLEESCISCGRSKGRHVIGEYCGPDVKII